MPRFASFRFSPRVLVVTSTLAGAHVGCGGHERAPYGNPNEIDSGSEDNGSGATGNEDDASNGGAPDDAASGGSGSGGSPGAERPSHPVYLYAEQGATHSTTRFCNIFDGTTVAEPTFNHSMLTAQISPDTNQLWWVGPTVSGGTNIDEHAGAACPDAAEDFGFHPTTAAVAKLCGSWFDETATALPVPAKYRDKDGLYFADGGLYAANGTALALSGATIATPDEPARQAVHSRPGGGFWVAVDSHAGTNLGDISRWSITPEGVVTKDGTYAVPGGFSSGPSLVLDELGAAYNTSSLGIVRMNSTFSGYEKVYDSISPTASCSTSEVWGVLVSTP